MATNSGKLIRHSIIFSTTDPDYIVSCSGLKNGRCTINK